MLNAKYYFFILFLVWHCLPVEANATLKCSRLIKVASGEQLINSCNSCRIVKLQRKRPGAAAPITRNYTVPPKTTTNLSFRGPGRSRVLSDTSCHPEVINDKHKENKSNKSSSRVGRRCILMQRIDKAGVIGLALANTCKECRIAVVDRIDLSGSRRSQNIAISGNSIIPLPAKGAAQAGIMSEKSCK
jgi:hypothetical protein